MTPCSVTAANHGGARYVAVLSCLLSALIACGGRSSNNGSAGDDTDSPTLSAGARGEAGGTRGGSDDTRSPGGSVDGGGGAGGGGTTDGVAGNTGTAGAAGMSGVGGAADDSCVYVAGAGDEPWFDLMIVGTAFHADEGERMRVVVATQSGNRVGIADLPIVRGAFMLSMPEVLNDGYYVGVTLYMDRNRNDTCETDEHAWDWTTRSVLGDMRFEVTPDEMCDDTLMSCRRWKPTKQACAVGTGETDLRDPLPCTP